MRIFINCDVELDGGAGGAEQFVACLLHGLSRLRTGHEFLLGVWPGQGEWLEAYMGEGMRRVPYPIEPAAPGSGLRGRVRRAASPAKRALRAAVGRSTTAASSGIATDWVDGLEPDVVHFPRQRWIPTAAPSLLNLHDLQHLHFPGFFGDEVLAERAVWRDWAARADLLPVHAEWTARDFVEKLGVAPDKVRALPGASPLELLPPPTDAEIEELRRRLQLPEVFGLYPATTWAHKNHLALVEALARLDGPRATIVCTGSKTDVWPRLEATVDRLGLGERFRFLGFLTPQELKAAYRLATFVIVPSLFEGGGSSSMYEAFGEGVPLACSDIPSVPAGVREAALRFDPTSVEAIADALRRMCADADLRAHLVELGREKAEHFSVLAAARGYLELYEELEARRDVRELDRA